MVDDIGLPILLAKYLGISTNWNTYPFRCYDENSREFEFRASYMYDFKLGEYLLSPIINELDNGGIIYGSSEYATMALKKLAEALDSKGKYVDTIKSINDGVNKKISFNILSGKSTKSFPKNAKKWNIEL